jgi:hypothetical protein
LNPASLPPKAMSQCHSERSEESRIILIDPPTETTRDVSLRST